MAQIVVVVAAFACATVVAWKVQPKSAAVSNFVLFPEFDYLLVEFAAAVAVARHLAAAAAAAVTWHNLLVSGSSFHCRQSVCAVSVLANLLLQQERAKRKELVPRPSWHPRHLCSSNHHSRNHSHMNHASLFFRMQAWAYCCCRCCQRASMISCLVSNFQGLRRKNLTTMDSN